MNFGCSFRRAGLRSLAVMLAAAAFAPASASAMSAPPGAPDLSPRLAELAKPAVRSASAAEQAARLSLAASGPGSLLREGNRLVVDVRYDSGAVAGVEALQAAGAEIINVSPRYQTVTIAARLADLSQIADLPRVGGVTQVLSPIVRADCGGAVRSEGDTQLNASSARASFGLDGSGVTVGILSDSFDRDPTAATHAAGDVASGDLPGPGSPCGSTTPVGVLEDSDSEGADEGRAMAQIVHDLAPGASIDFASATASRSQFSFAANIRALAAAGAKVITDDIAYFEEPFFQDGPVAVAVNEVVAAGVSYFSAAGNDNLIDKNGRDIASWEAPKFRDSETCPAAIIALSKEVEKAEEKEGHAPQGLHPSHCMDFNPEVAKDDTFGITVEKGETLMVDLQWAEPWSGVGTDLDAFLLNEEEKFVEVEVEGESFPDVSVEDNVNVSKTPFEFLFWENTGPEQEVRLVINRYSGGEPRLKFALLENGRGVSKTEYPKSSAGDTVGPTIYGHSGAAGAIAVGAVRYNSNPLAPEAFSSRGPVTHYFGPVAGPSPAAPIAPQVISKPDLVATDCGVTTFFFQPTPSSPPPFRFCGTSAAAPHAAAVAALLRQANPGASAAQVRAALTGTARPVGAFGPTAVGAGLVDAFGAVDLLALPPTVTITKAPEPLSRNRRPAIEFSANRPVAFSCQVDGGAPQPCASPFVVPTALGDGSHGIAVSGVDLAGRTASSSTAPFVIDTKAPRTKIAKHPPKLIRTHRRKVRESFRFSANEADVTFVCKVDRSLLRFCARRISRSFGAGRHTLQVRARDRAGNVDRTPAVFHFRVKRLG
jgi:hypothetical protein